MHLAHEEFLSTEKHYLDDLKALAELSKAVPAFGAAAASSSAAIFLNVQEILLCNETFAARCMDDGCSVAQLARAFLVCRKEMIRVYRPYVMRHENAIQILDAHVQDAAFQEVVRTFLSSMGRSSLTNMLIKPVQRICKYPLLFAQLIDNISDSADAEFRRLLQQALDCSLAICAAVEDQVASSPRVDPLMQKLLRNTHRSPGYSTLSSATRRLSDSLPLSPPASPPKQPPLYGGGNSGSSSPTSRARAPSQPNILPFMTLPHSVTAPELPPSHASTSPPVAAPALRRSGSRHVQRERLLQEMMRLLAELTRVQKELTEVCV
jgi:hypothetical protein